VGSNGFFKTVPHPPQACATATPATSYNYYNDTKTVVTTDMAFQAGILSSALEVLNLKRLLLLASTYTASNARNQGKASKMNAAERRSWWAVHLNSRPILAEIVVAWYLHGAIVRDVVRPCSKIFSMDDLSRSSNQARCFVKNPGAGSNSSGLSSINDD
jgi:hypothetical protein